MMAQTNYRDLWESTTRDHYARGGYYLPVTLVQPPDDPPYYEIGPELTLEEALAYRGSVRIILKRDVPVTTLT